MHCYQQQLWATKKNTVEGHRKALWIEVNPIALGVGALVGSVGAVHCCQHLCVWGLDHHVNLRSARFSKKMSFLSLDHNAS